MKRESFDLKLFSSILQAVSASKCGMSKIIFIEKDGTTIYKDDSIHIHIVIALHVGSRFILENNNYSV